jgi:hypothetical protein
MGAELFHADGQTDMTNETKESLFAILRQHLVNALYGHVVDVLMLNIAVRSFWNQECGPQVKSV